MIWASRTWRLSILYINGQLPRVHLLQPTPWFRLLGCVNSSGLQLIVSCTQATLLKSRARIQTSFDHIPSSSAFSRCGDHMRVIQQQQLPESTDATTPFTTEFRKSCCGFALRKKKLPDQHKVEQSSLIHCCDTQYE